MAILKVRTWGDPVLKTKAQPVTEITEDIRRWVQDMFETMAAEGGIGQDYVVALGLGVELGVGGVDPPDLGALHEDVGVDFHGAQGGRGVGGEIRVTRAGSEDHYSTLIEMAGGTPAYKGLSYLPHFNGSLDAGYDTEVLQSILQSHRIDHSSQHPHVISRYSPNIIVGGFCPPKDIAATYYNGYLYSRLMN